MLIILKCSFECFGIYHFFDFEATLYLYTKKIRGDSFFFAEIHDSGISAYLTAHVHNKIIMSGILCLLAIFSYLLGHKE